MELLPSSQSCPYCDAPLELLIDPNDSGAEYIEDCQVCCQPMRVLAEIGPEGDLAGIALLREDD